MRHPVYQSPALISNINERGWVTAQSWINWWEKNYFGQRQQIKEVTRDEGESLFSFIYRAYYKYGQEKQELPALAAAGASAAVIDKVWNGDKKV